MPNANKAIEEHLATLREFIVILLSLILKFLVIYFQDHNISHAIFNY
jgi:hypothetical protein